MTTALSHRVLERLPDPSADERRRRAEHPDPSPATHAAALDALAVFDAVELRPAGGGGRNRFLRPRSRESLFGVGEQAGYTWQDFEEGAATARAAPGLPPTLTLDWFLTRAVEVAGVRVVPAVAGGGSPVSDHELIALDGVAMRGPEP